MGKGKKDRTALYLYGGFALFALLVAGALYLATSYENKKDAEYKLKVEECRNSGLVWTGYEYDETIDDYNPAQCMTAQQAKYEECENKASTATSSTLSDFYCTPEGELKMLPN